MLELRNIKKDYPAGNGVVHALKGINLKFRKNEFVAILGQSGCGKTTMLNIIGGLDQYSDGDLLINHVSTKNYKDRDWDAYRNHSIGFVFQSYNLIPHQSVLQNVELALTLSGVSKKERKERAIKALEAVGLSDQIHKKPNAMSGGQMQRVAIARAIVNDPEIILADEPTGALDSETSVQVMEILKEIAKDRLVIMVTHNPDLANTYATRIIKMLDGNVIDDSMPLVEMEAKKEESNKKKPSMSFATSFTLSLKNLFTKKGRTLLTSFAGSIGIIGIALIFAISQGLHTYINEVQESTLSSYPLSIQESVVDLSSVMQTFMNVGSEEVNHDEEAIYSKSSIYEMIDALNNAETIENDLKSFKQHVETARKEDEKLHEAINSIQYSYDFDLQVFSKNEDGDVIFSDTESLLSDLVIEYMNIDMNAMMDARNASPMGSMMASTDNSMKLWQELLPGQNGEMINDVIKKQYDVIYGEWPDAYNEVVLVVDQNNELDDMTLYALGLESKENVDKIMNAALNQSDLDLERTSYSYQEICEKTYRVVLNSDCYSYDEANGIYSDLRDSQAGLKYLYDQGIELKVSGIIRQNENSDIGMLTGSIAYLSDLTKYVIEENENSKVIKAQLDSKEIDIFNGLPFKENTKNLTDKQKQKEFEKFIDSKNDEGKAQVYLQMKSIPTKEQMDDLLKQAKGDSTRSENQEMMVEALKGQMSVDEKELVNYLDSMSDEEFDEMFDEMLKEQIKAQYATSVLQQMQAIPTAQLLMMLEQEEFTLEQYASFYDEIIEFSNSTYENNLRELGYVSLDVPSAVHLYASTFENKDVIEDMIADYNEGVEEMSKITYTDYVGIMMSGITSVINAITYILIAFVAISLIVSSIMIGVITLISVQERTKEIGILRAIGASKKDVSSMFNAETLIIGFAAGLIGVVTTYLLCIPINMIIHEVTGIMNVNAYLPIPVAITLIAISMILTMFAGIIPSRSAAKKDPVVALRSE